MEHAIRMAPRWLFALVFVSSLAWPGALAAQDATPVASPVAGEAEYGVRLENMDPSADPAEDFLRFAAGGFQDRNEIPADNASYGSFDVVYDRTTEQLLDLLDRLSGSEAVPVGTDEWKAIQVYRQYADLDHRETQGVAPIQPDLDAINAIGTRDEFYDYLRDGVFTSNAAGLHQIFADADLADSSVTAAWYQGPDLGLPNRDYYWEDDEGNEAIREAYRAYAAELLGFVDYGAERAERSAAAVFAFEKRLAEPLLRPEDFNDPANYYHPTPVADLIAANPGFDWEGFLAILGIPAAGSVIVTEPAYLDAVDAIVAETDLNTLKDFLKVQVLRATAPFLTAEVGAAYFAFEGTTLYGIQERAPVEERALNAVNENLGFALGKLYVAEYFPPEAKVQIEELVARLIAAARVRIEALDWMSAETKATAIGKLDTMRVKVGYPDEWRTYAEVGIEESYVQTIRSAVAAEAKRTLANVGKPVDRDEWFALPQEVNAFYNPSNNEIVFPAGILQDPFFDYRADPASNYGAIGAVIGHEITHAFDQSGSQFDANGNFTDWWTDEDRAEFETYTAEITEQYSAIEVLPGLNVDGALTIGENIADLGGLQIAHDALAAELAASGDPGPIDDLTQDQRFFVATAFVWGGEAREEYLRTLIQSDEHAPDRVRAVQPARNMDEFFTAFGIQPGDAMYLPPEERVVIW